jgi:hypothetical protein
MRTVKDPRGVTWICLELPVVPPGVAMTSADPGDRIALECNSGAERAVVLVTPDWEETMDDGTLLATIIRSLTR